MINTVRGRLTLWYVSALALILVVFGVAVYVMLSRALHRRVDEGLRSTLEISITSLTHDTQEGQSSQSAAQRMMGEQTRRLSRIVQDMFILARADAGRYPLQNSALYLNDLLDEVARAGGLLASDKNVTVELTNLPEAAFHGDEDLLRQMVMNLVDNAVKFTPAGGVVRLSLTRRADEYLLTVSDTGPGIPAEAREHVFERFYRADKARSRSEDGGAGLGLAIARWIARAHDGDLRLADSDGTGATFIVRLHLSPRN